MQGYYDPHANWDLIPQHMRDGVVRYVMHGHPVGGFMTAILSNDFMTAAGKADDQNARALLGWAQFLYNYAPIGSFGSPENVRKWQAEGGLLGKQFAATAK